MSQQERDYCYIKLIQSLSLLERSRKLCGFAYFTFVIKPNTGLYSTVFSRGDVVLSPITYCIVWCHRK